MFESILVVCVGNICRSPIGERLLKNRLNSKSVESAGIAAVVGKPADKIAQSIAEGNQLSLGNHIARQLTKDMCRQNSLILVMEKRHVEDVCQLVPEVRGKIMLFSHWNGQKDIPDPFMKSREAFEIVYKMLDESAQKWAKVLNQ
jgi:protein-tyrosine phosphatase